MYFKIINNEQVMIKKSKNESKMKDLGYEKYFPRYIINGELYLYLVSHNSVSNYLLYDDQEFYSYNDKRGYVPEENIKEDMVYYSYLIKDDNIKEDKDTPHIDIVEYNGEEYIVYRYTHVIPYIYFSDFYYFWNSKKDYPTIDFCTEDFSLLENINPSALYMFEVIYKQCKEEISINFNNMDEKYIRSIFDYFSNNVKTKIG